MTVKDIIAQMISWTENGYLDRAVWTNFAQEINPAALPDNIETLQLPAQATYPHHVTALTSGQYPPYTFQLPSTAFDVHQIQQTSTVS